jgi:hypothetical protein
MTSTIRLSLAAELRALMKLPLETRDDVEAWYGAAEVFEAHLDSASLVDELPHLVWHFLADADIRARDAKYREAQEAGVEAAIQRWLMEV